MPLIPGARLGSDDVILFAPIGGSTIFKVPAAGGKPEAVSRLDTTRGENAHYWPLLLPGGQTFLYFVRSARPENNGIYIAAMDGSAPSRLVSSLSSGLYAPPLDRSPGYLLWVQNNELLAQALDTDRATLSGQPVAITSGVRVLEGQLGVLGSVSRTGALAWASSRAASAQFTWFDRNGSRRESVPVDEGELYQPAISLDGGRLLYTRVANGTADVFLYNLTTKMSQRITQSPDYDEQAI